MRLAKTSPGRSRTGRRLTCATAAAVTMFVAPGPIEVVQAIMRRRACALANAMAAMGHRLLVVSPERGELRLGGVERLAEPRHVAVAEDRPHAAEERRLASVRLRALGAEVPDQRLGHREPHGAHLPASSRECARTLGLPESRLDGLSRAMLTSRAC